MDLRKLQESWNGFPEISMEERPLLSSDLEKMALQNPFAGPFYLRNKLLARIVAGSALWLLTICQLRITWRTDGADIQQQALTLLLLTYFIYYHARLLYDAGYPNLASLRLIPFLSRIEMAMEKYMHSFRIISCLAGVYTLTALEKLFSMLDNEAYGALNGNSLYKWVIMIFFSISFYILFLHTGVQRYKKLMLAVRSYREGIILAKPQKR
jgi:hypothetical protein